MTILRIILFLADFVGCLWVAFQHHAPLSWWLRGLVGLTSVGLLLLAALETLAWWWNRRMGDHSGDPRPGGHPSP